MTENTAPTAAELDAAALRNLVDVTDEIRTHGIAVSMLSCFMCSEGRGIGPTTEAATRALAEHYLQMHPESMLAIVVADQAESADDGDDPAEMIAHARNTLALPGRGGVGGYEIQDYSESGHDDHGFIAYYALLIATDEQITSALMKYGY